MNNYNGVVLPKIPPDGWVEAMGSKLSRRDEFAKAALRGLLASGNYGPEAAVKASYKCADSMIIESEKTHD